MKSRSRWAAHMIAAGAMTLSGMMVVFAAEAVTTTKNIENATENNKVVVEEETPNVAGITRTIVMESESKEETEAVQETVQEPETQVQETETTAVSEYDNKFMVNIDEYLNIREQADENSAVVGKLFAGAGGEVLEYGEQWTKISSGNVQGYAATQYLLFGEDARVKAEQSCEVKVTILEDSIRVRKSPNTESGVWGLAEKDSVYTATNLFDGWAEINYDGETGYVSLEFATAERKIGTAISIEEEQEQIRKQQEEIASKQAEEQRKQEEILAAEKKAAAQSQYVETVKTSAYSVSEEDVYLLACLVHAEAGYEPYEGKLAVANVVLNRLSGGKYGSTMHSVVYASGQFSVASSGRLATVMAQGPNSESVAAAEEALSGVNNVPDYNNFCDLGSASYSRYNSYSIIGSQVFYK